MRDSGLLHYLLHLRDRNDLMAHPRIGQSWESVVIETLLRALRDFVAERNCRYGIVINNDERPRLLDENLLGLPLAALRIEPPESLRWQTNYTRLTVKAPTKAL